MDGGTLIPEELVPGFQRLMEQGVAYGPTFVTNYNAPPPPLKAFPVTYKGLGLGGVAVVLADASDTACDMVREHHGTIVFEHVKAQEVGQGDKASVLFNDNGDY